jgi:hypothetical protein
MDHHPGELHCKRCRWCILVVDGLQNGICHEHTSRQMHRSRMRNDSPEMGKGTPIHLYVAASADLVSVEDHRHGLNRRGMLHLKVGLMHRLRRLLSTRI